MNPSIDKLIAKAESLAKSEDPEGARVLADELTRHYPEDARVWSLSGFLYALRHDYSSAISDLSNTVRIQPDEPVHFFNRGRYYLALGEDSDAVSDFGRGIDLCDHYGNDYYRETLLFMRAEAFARLGRKHQALADLAHVRPDFKIWTYRLISKAELLDECHKLTGTGHSD